MPETKQINATVETELVDKITDLADTEKRSFSQMVAILLAESVETRKSKENGLKSKN